MQNDNIFLILLLFFLCVLLFFSCLCFVSNVANFRRNEKYLFFFFLSLSPFCSLNKSKTEIVFKLISIFFIKFSFLLNSVLCTLSEQKRKKKKTHVSEGAKNNNLTLSKGKQLKITSVVLSFSKIQNTKTKNLFLFKNLLFINRKYRKNY